MKPFIYLDNSATTCVRDEVRQVMEPFEAQWWGNASSIHRLGSRSREAIEGARASVAKLLGANSDEIFFTPCATYSNNVAILGRARYVEENGLGRHIITSAIEHSSALGPARELAAQGWRVTILGVDRQGSINLEELKAAITPATSIISVMWANNEIGTVQPIQEIAAIAAEHDIFFHTDAVQVAGKLPIDVSAVKIDTLSISGHKFHGPKGIGALYVRRGSKLLPIVFGGGQERGLFPGTENVANIVGIGKAAELSFSEMSVNLPRLQCMQQILIDKLVRNYSGAALTGASDITRRVPGHVSIIVRDAIGEDMVREADEQGVFVSSVSACSSKGGHPSHVLKALGFTEREALGGLRITAGTLNTEDECLRAAAVLAGMVLGRRSVPVIKRQQPALIA